MSRLVEIVKKVGKFELGIDGLKSIWDSSRYKEGSLRIDMPINIYQIIDFWAKAYILNSELEILSSTPFPQQIGNGDYNGAILTVLNLGFRIGKAEATKVAIHYLVKASNFVNDRYSEWSVKMYDRLVNRIIPTTKQI